MREGYDPLDITGLVDSLIPVSQEATKIKKLALKGVRR